MIKAVVQLTMVYPYTQSLFHLFDFMSLWNCNLLSYKPYSSKTMIAIPSDKFKILFGENPRVGKYQIPVGAEYFMEEVEVKEIKIK